MPARTDVYATHYKWSVTGVYNPKKEREREKWEKKVWREKIKSSQEHKTSLWLTLVFTSASFPVHEWPSTSSLLQLDIRVTEEYSYSLVKAFPRSATSNGITRNVDTTIDDNYNGIKQRIVDVDSCELQPFSSSRIVMRSDVFTRTEYI